MTPSERADLVDESYKIVKEISDVRRALRLIKMEPGMTRAVAYLFNASCRGISETIKSDRWNKQSNFCLSEEKKC